MVPAVVQASVVLVPKVVAAQVVPLEQLASVQQVSSHLLAVHTPDRQSLPVPHVAPGVPPPSIRLPAAAAERQ